MSSIQSDPMIERSTQVGDQTRSREAHILRTVAAAEELARKCRWSEYKRLALVHAAAQHHDSSYWLSKLYWDRVMRDALDGHQAARPVGANREIETRELSKMLKLACFLAQRWEAMGDELSHWSQINAELDRQVADGFVDERHVHVMRQRVRSNAELIAEVIGTLPVFPTVALQAMQIASDPMSAGQRLEDTLNSDPVLAGELLRTANSAAYSPRSPITTIRQAVLLIGMSESCRVIAAALFRPMFNGAAMRPLWNHSLEAARAAESLARMSGTADPEEAFLAGLLHDIGRLAMLKLPPELVSRFTAMIEGGCELHFAEVMVLGFDHCAAGRQVLEAWDVPEPIRDAVINHHYPEQTDNELASVLYLAEHLTQSREQLESRRRMRWAIDRLQINEAMIQSLPMLGLPPG